MSRTRNVVGAAALVAGCGLWGGVSASDAPDVPQGWQRSGKIGLFLDFKSAQNHEESRDTNINEGENSTNLTLAGDATFTWTQDRKQTEHRIELRYSQEKTGGDDWVEDDDLIEYRGVYRQYWSQISFAYGSAGLDSIFSGPEPDEAFMNPTDVRAAAGVGQLRLWGEWKNSLEYRIGLHAQDIWGDEQYIDDWEDDPQLGVEGLIHYILAPNDKLNYYIRLEAFAPFDDGGNMQFLLTSGFSYKMLEYLSLDWYFRGYYEGHPEDAPDDAPGYDELSYRNSLLLGVTYTF
jgi:hypothetical protein